MALNRREFLLGLPLAASGLSACAPLGRGNGARAQYVELSATSPAKSARGKILVCMPETAQTREVWSGLCDELRRDFELVAVRVDGSGGDGVIAQGIARHRPSALVLMNNPTVNAYREYQQETAARRFPPAVIVMTSFLDGKPLHVRTATGISYEVPLITVATNLRKLLVSPIERVGVVVRAPLREFVHHQVELARREQIQVEEEVVARNPNVSELRRALRRLKQRVDALWVLNDDRLLTPELIGEGWLRGLNERPWKPAIVGARSLVSSLQSFGTFAVLPDHTALGVQAASMLYDIADNQWRLPDDAGVELPLSTTTSIDLAQVRERFALRRDALSLVDNIVE
jgi:hypothetical protein